MEYYNMILNKTLVGYTGFVGSNILKSQHFNYLLNSKNIHSIQEETNYGFVIYAGVRAEKYLANINPDQDMQNIQGAINNIKRLNPDFLVLISTVDIYKMPVNVDEDTPIDTDGLHAYGLNRYRLEKWVENNIPNHLIVRLPGLYGDHIKKNFIFDMINLIPTMIKEDRFHEITSSDKVLMDYYRKQENGFYKVIDLDNQKRKHLRDYFKHRSFNSLCFTDADSSFQFYHLSYLWEHIQLAYENGIKLLNIATQPVTASEIFEHVFGKKFENRLKKPPAKYEMKTKYAELLGGEHGYIFNKEFILSDIKQFVEERLSQ